MQSVAGYVHHALVRLPQLPVEPDAALIAHGWIPVEFITMDSPTAVEAV
jgi:hypothetical protein